MMIQIIYKEPCEELESQYLPIMVKLKALWGTTGCRWLSDDTPSPGRL